jgi:cell division protein FtsB
VAGRKSATPGSSPALAGTTMGASMATMTNNQRGNRPSSQALAIALAALTLLGAAFRPGAVSAQENAAVSSATNAGQADLAKQVAELRAVVQELQAQVKELQQEKWQAARPAPTPTNIQPGPNDSFVAPAPSDSAPTQSAQAQPLNQAPSQVPSKVPDLLGGTTVSFLIDGYYAYNFNDPIGRVNLLRAYDVLSNAFSLNQADIVFENAPDPADGRRFGGRVDLQFGQATETLQGNATNEPRPAVYRNIFQAYGTYIVPIGSGLTVDFGKWASSLGIEGNYTQDQMNYSRSYWFDFLPFYHMGARVHYQFNDKFGVNYWVINGTDQTEPFNGYKDEMFGVVLQPTKTISWTINSYLGQEHADFEFVTSGPPSLPEQQGMPFEPILNPPQGKLHIIDSYATWNATPKLTFAGEGDYVIERLLTTSPPSHTDGGAVYIHYQVTPKVALAARSEYLSDHGGLYSGKTQALKETTATFEYRFSHGFLMREEFRRDWSNQPYFLSDTLGLLKTNQTTATLGLVWWFGGKEGAW